MDPVLLFLNIIYGLNISKIAKSVISRKTTRLLLVLLSRVWEFQTDFSYEFNK